MLKENYNVVGVMSGTSLDGIDLAHIIFTVESGKWRFEILETQTVPYDANIYETLKIAVSFTEDRLEQLITQSVSQVRVVRLLCAPKLVELFLQMAAVRVEIIARFGFSALRIEAQSQAGAHCWGLARVIDGGAAFVQELAVSARAGGHHGHIKPGGAVFDLATLIVASIGFAVGFEATALVDMEQGAT